MKKFLCVFAIVAASGSWAAELRQIVIVSRHNLRAPLDTAVQDLRESTTNTWFTWTSAPGELSRKGAALETAMGGWFRDWLVEEGLCERNARLTPDHVHFFANNMQRTVATARCFAAGFMPEADVVVEHLPFDGPRDSRFSIGVPKADAALSNRVYRQIAEMMGGEGGLDRQLAPAYALLGRIIDYPSSPRGSRPGAAPFASTGVSYFDLVRPPNSIGLHGPIGEAYPVADSLLLQLYEDNSPAASFGYPLSWSGWRLIGDVKEVYIDMRYRTKAMSAALGARLLPEIGGALRRDDLRLTFVGGHDTTIAWMGAQLDVEPYELPGTVECRTPIGSKIVLGRWRCEDGVDRVSVDLVYQTTAQIRAGQFADSAHPPRVVRLRLKGISPDADERYPLSKVLPRLLSPDPGL